MNTKTQTDTATFLHKWLHFNSPVAARLSAEYHMTAFAMCDGYGKRSQANLMAAGLSWDWSHVRDSSEAALKETEQYLRSVGCK